MFCNCCKKRVSICGHVLIVFRIYYRKTDDSFRFVNVCWKCGRKWYPVMHKYNYHLYSN